MNDNHIVFNIAFEYSKLYLQDAINRACGHQPSTLDTIAKASVSMAFKLVEETDKKIEELDL